MIYFFFNYDWAHTKYFKFIINHTYLNTLDMLICLFPQDQKRNTYAYACTMVDLSSAFMDLCMRACARKTMHILSEKEKELMWIHHWKRFRIYIENKSENVISSKTMEGLCECVEECLIHSINKIDVFSAAICVWYYENIL